MGRHLFAHVDRDAADLVVPHVAFTGVQANSDVDAKTRRGGADGARAPDRAGGSVEGADETAGQRLEAPASEPLELVRFLKSIDRDTEPFLNVTIPLKACGPQ